MRFGINNDYTKNLSGALQRLIVRERASISSSSLTQNEIEEIHSREVQRQRAAANALAVDLEKGKAKGPKIKQDAPVPTPATSNEEQTDLEDELQSLRVSILVHI